MQWFCIELSKSTAQHDKGRYKWSRNFGWMKRQLTRELNWLSPAELFRQLLADKLNKTEDTM